MNLVKPSNQIVSSTSFVDDSHLEFSVVSGGVYTIKGCIILDWTDVDPDGMHIALGELVNTFPSGSTVFGPGSFRLHNTEIPLMESITHIYLDGTIIAASNGTVKYRWRLTDAAYGFTVLAGSHLVVDHLNAGSTIQPGKYLLHSNETPVTEIVSSTAESSALRSYTLAANDYNHYIVEVGVRNRLEQDETTRCDYTWRLKEDGTTVRTETARIIGMNTSGADSGNRETTVYSWLRPAGGGTPVTLTVTSQMSLSNASTGAQLLWFRVWGVKV